MTSEEIKTKYGTLTGASVEQDLQKAKAEATQEVVDFIIEALKGYNSGSAKINPIKQTTDLVIPKAVPSFVQPSEDFSELFPNVQWRTEVRKTLTQAAELLNVHQVANIVLMHIGYLNPTKDMRTFVRKKMSVVLSQLHDAGEFKRWEDKKEGELSGTFYYGLPDKFNGDSPIEFYMPLTKQNEQNE